VSPPWPAGPRVLVLGSGLMGAAIAAEYARGGVDTTVASRDPARALERVGEILRDAGEADVPLAVTDDAARYGPFDLVVESLPEQMDLKVAALAPLAAAWPDATIATNTSSLSVTELGERIGAPERIIATHYLNPVLLMPIVEVVAGARTDAVHAARASELLRSLGKIPVAVRDVPGFVINRLQFALLRECSWLVAEGVVTAADLERIVSDGLARRWRQTGPLTTAALGGAATFERIAANLFPALAGREHPPTLPGVPRLDSEQIAELTERRNRALAQEFA
jgi:3-hydroxybutyryl-CoA dehydrogenase